MVIFLFSVFYLSLGMALLVDGPEEDKVTPGNLRKLGELSTLKSYLVWIAILLFWPVYNVAIIIYGKGKKP